MATYREIYQNALQLRNDIRKSEALAWAILAHPDATANNVMQVHEMVVRNRAEYRKVYESMLKLGAGRTGALDPLNLQL